MSYETAIICEATPVVSEDTWMVEDCTGYFDLQPTGNGKTGRLMESIDDQYGWEHVVFLTADELRGLAKVALNIANTLESEE